MPRAALTRAGPGFPEPSRKWTCPLQSACLEGAQSWELAVFGLPQGREPGVSVEEDIFLLEPTWSSWGEGLGPRSLES